MRVTNVLKDDDAVSPVIGVILMVAITVILAAVIASFVLGLGDQADDVQPTTSFSTDYTAGEQEHGTDSEISFISAGTASAVDGVFTATVDSGEAVATDELYIRGSGYDDLSARTTTYEDPTWENYVDASQASASTDTGGHSAVTGGDSVDVDVMSDYDINIVWESRDTGTSATLSSDTGPDA